MKPLRCRDFLPRLDSNDADGAIGILLYDVITKYGCHMGLLLAAVQLPLSKQQKSL